MLKRLAKVLLIILICFFCGSKISKATTCDSTKLTANKDKTQTNSALLQQFSVDIEGMVPSFKSDIYEYDLTISSNINNVEVLAIPQNPNAIVEITGNIRSKVGIEYYKNKSNFTG